MSLERSGNSQKTNLFVGNLDDVVDDKRLREEFSKFGNVKSARVIREGRRSKGFGFVCFSTHEEAVYGKANMHGRIIEAKPLNVIFAKDRRDCFADLANHQSQMLNLVNCQQNEGMTDLRQDSVTSSQMGAMTLSDELYRPSFQREEYNHVPPSLLNKDHFAYRKQNFPRNRVARQPQQRVENLPDLYRRFENVDIGGENGERYPSSRQGTGTARGSHRGMRNSRGFARGGKREDRRRTNQFTESSMHNVYSGEASNGGRGRSGNMNRQHVNTNRLDNSRRNDIGYRMLKSWSEMTDVEELVLLISNKVDALTKLLSTDVNDDWLILVIKIMMKILDSRLYNLKQKGILKVFAESICFSRSLSNFLLLKQPLLSEWREASEFIAALLKIVSEIIKLLPDCAQICNLPLSLLSNMEPVTSNPKFTQAISELRVSAMQTSKLFKERQMKGSFCRPDSDNEKPPEDFKELPVIPAITDLNTDTAPFLRAAVTKGAYKDQAHYLDVLFRLTREDFLKPLRNGIKEYIEHDHKKMFKSSDVRIYNDVHFIGMTQEGGIQHVLQFDVSKLKHVKWDHSKRLINGNLVCLSNDNFENNLIFATVSFRDRKMLEEGNINIVCHSGLDVVLKTTANCSFVMLETMAYFEAVKPILIGLQAIECDLPMKEYIVECNKKLKPPSYLLNGVKKYDINCLMKSDQNTEISVLNTLSWPPEEAMCLNESQRAAAMLALTKEISIIQGPPGTGKTYVGLKVMQVLLENQCRMGENEQGGGDPILVICYTNHALDQFLEGILPFLPQGIVRVGGKCSSELEKFNLRNLRKDRKQITSKAWKYSLRETIDRRKFASETINIKKKEIDSLGTDICNEDMLESCMSQTHRDSLLSQHQQFYVKKKKKKMHQWLNVSGTPFLQVLPAMLKHHLTKLVMQCLNEIPNANYQRPAKAKKSQKRPITERVRFYQSWLRNYQKYLEACQQQKNLTFNDRGRFANLYQQSTRPSLLNDSEIRLVLTEEIYQVFEKDLGNYSSDCFQNNCAVATWVLGIHQELYQQLDDVEMLNKFIHKNQTPSPEEKEDDFDDSEETDIMRRKRLLDGDMELDEEKNLKATQKVKTEGASLLARAKLLGISEDVIPENDDIGRDNYVDDDGFTRVTYKKPITFSQVGKYLSDVKLPPMSEEEAESINDVWSLDSRKRFSLYKFWLQKYQINLITQMEGLVTEYNFVDHELKEIRMKEDIELLKGAKVIGMTTTGAAKNKALLDAVGCRIIIVEEAAEVLEAHIVTAINQNCKHMVLIGDHQQLRPSPTVYEHAKFFGMDVSLFERLINNDIPHVTLCEQHRMRESISKIMRHIYPKLTDHKSVQQYENIRGVSKNIFFIQHIHDEETVKDSLSKSNPHEAKYLISLCKYFFLQGYEASQITILATYAGQVLTLKKEMKENKFHNEVRITSVDNFQGEENDIILLSLVRSNAKSSVGFLKVDNRVCVALSRAKKGLFAIGNIKLLAQNSELWTKILQTAEEDEITGNGLPLSCPNHPDTITMIQNPEDFKKCPEGGCKLNCTFRLDCGHACSLLCHGYDLDHKIYQCRALCKKSCPEGHPCRKKCSDKCGLCQIKVDKTISLCGHTNKFPCHLIPKESDCYSQCGVVLPCGHSCQGTCRDCFQDGKHRKCEEKVTYFWPCDHTVQVPCHFKPNENPCPKTCGEVLTCGHICKGKCSDCMKGAVHKACVEKCAAVLPCGHTCSSFCSIPCPPCKLPCSTSCRHSNCNSKNQPRTCGESCIECHEICWNKCSHRKCSKKCFEECDVKECDEACFKVLDCGHECSSLCGSNCVCRYCNKVSLMKILEKPSTESQVPDIKDDQNKDKSHVIKLPSCRHVFCVSELDEYMRKMSKQDSTEYIVCPSPTCFSPIQRCSRYHTVLQQRAQKREKAKSKLLSSHSLSSKQKLELSRSHKLLEGKDQNLSFWSSWRHFDYINLDTAGKIQATVSKVKFAYVLCEIQTLETERAATSDLDIKSTEDTKDRISAVLSIKEEMTSQQIDEFKADLKRLVIFKYLTALKTTAEDHKLTIGESTMNRLSRVLKRLKENKPSADAMKDGLTLMPTLEIETESQCLDLTEKANLVLKKKAAKKALDILRADNKQMLSEIFTLTSMDLLQYYR